MKIFSISDLHLSNACPKPMDIFGQTWNNYWEKIKLDWQNNVSQEDLVLIAGDISWATKLDDALVDLEDISSLNGTKIIIKGNHEHWWNSYSKVKEVLPKTMFAIQNNALLFDKYIICGTRGWVLPNNKSTADDLKIYNRELIRLKLTLDEATKIYNKNPNEYKIILMLHYPPFNVLWQDSEVTNLISSYPVSHVLYGHLHGKDCRTQDVIYKNDIPYHITSCDQINFRLKLIAED